MFRIQQLLLMIAAAGVLHGQITQLDLHFQSRDVDFSTANATKPFKSGATLPVICGTGEMFFNLTAPAGSNLYGCTSLNAWTLESTSSGGSGVMASQLGDFAVARSSATVLTIGANCAVSTPCNVRFGSLVYSFASGGSVSVSAGTGVAYVYISATGALTVGQNLTANCTSGCVAQSGVTSFPRMRSRYSRGRQPAGPGMLPGGWTSARCSAPRASSRAPGSPAWRRPARRL